MRMRISANGIDLIKRFEALRLIAYDDFQPRRTLKEGDEIQGTLTIGWGHTANVWIGRRITPIEADNLLMTDLTRFERAVNNPRFVPFTNDLNQNQFDALVSFAFNVGEGNLGKLCRRRSIPQIPDGMRLYIRSKGRVLAGLVRRREMEATLFTTPII